MTATRKSGFRPSIESLEDRALMSVSSLTLNASKTLVTVWANNSDTSVVVNSIFNGVQIKDTAANKAWNYTGVTEVDFVGGMGNDRFVNNVSAIKTRAWGNNGNDYLEGANGADMFVGGYGDDTLVGYGGDDTLFGEGGNDVLKAMDGNDQLIGADGDDTLVGGAGTDSLWGGSGSNTLVAIDGGTGDYVRAEGFDSVWVDLNGKAADTVSAALPANVKVQQVASFANGADRTLDGDSIADPKNTTGYAYKRFSGPLFSSAGPAMTDIIQGTDGDCWLMATLAGIARTNP
jgi:hypothetical protein